MRFAEVGKRLAELVLIDQYRGNVVVVETILGSNWTARFKAATALSSRPCRA